MPDQLASRVAALETLVRQLQGGLLAGALSMTAIDATAAQPNVAFVDKVDGKLKFKDGSGTVNALY
jgi:hypothetical protein